MIIDGIPFNVIQTKGVVLALHFTTKSRSEADKAHAILKNRGFVVGGIEYEPSASLYTVTGEEPLCVPEEPAFSPTGETLVEG